jgi:eukaryotic-like serine/threonine-protein kinase
MSLPELDGYKINQQIATGGMAKIYDAIQISLNRPVAIKFLSRSLLDHHEAMSLFERESLIIAQLNHPNIVQVIDKGISSQSQPYFVMEKINGIDLSELIAEADLPFSKKIDIAIQTCKGLSYAHKNNVIHRDIKPANIIIDQHGNAKILDFGIALSDSENDNPQQTTSVVGTLGYIAPEQENNYAKATVASDIYSFGMLLKKLFCRGQEEHGKTDQAIKKLPKALSDIIYCCTEQEPNKRYSTLAEVRDLLLQASQGSHLNKSKFKQAQQDTQDLSSQFDLLDVLCKSQQKRVYLFQKKTNHQLIVIKRQLSSTKGLKQARILSSLKHPNIVQVYAAAKTNGNFVLITEYLSGGSLANQLLQDMNEQTFLAYACQICSAVHFAHQNNIQHSNLSPENILFDNKQNIKVGDFGQTRENIDGDEILEKYHPPGKQAFSEQYDVYCMGAIFHHMLYGVPAGESPIGNTRKLSFRLQKLIDKMLAIDPINRPTTAQQVLIELQRIARSGNTKNQPSNIAKKHHSEQPKTKIKKKILREKKPESSSKKLSIALAISISLIIFLLVKDFFK